VLGQDGKPTVVAWARVIRVATVLVLAFVQHVTNSLELISLHLSTVLRSDVGDSQVLENILFLRGWDRPAIHVELPFSELAVSG
jgi:hypothetical protein